MPRAGQIYTETSASFEMVAKRSLLFSAVPRSAKNYENITSNIKKFNADVRAEISFYRQILNNKAQIKDKQSQLSCVSVSLMRQYPS
jgi:protein involved in sex pheromone biosynthesis